MKSYEVTLKYQDGSYRTIKTEATSPEQAKLNAVLLMSEIDDIEIK